MECLTFKLLDAEYGVRVDKVREVLELVPMTMIPRMPGYMKGVINIRGNVVPVIDLRLKFELEEAKPTQDTSIIVLEIQMQYAVVVVGIIVDSVQAVIDINQDEIMAAPEIGIDVNNDFILGMGNVDGKFVTLLDIDKIITTKELSNLIPEATEGLELEA